jgi:hypothetical protein
MIESRDHVLIVPYVRPFVGGPDLEVIPDHARRRHGENFEDEFPDQMRDVEAEFLAGRYLYGGPMYFHFGHVMVDSTTRLWAFDRKRHAGIVFAGLERSGPTPNWLFEVMTLFGVSESNLQIIGRPTVVESLDFPTPGSMVGFDVEPWYLDYLDDLSGKLNSSVPRLVYLGRTHIRSKGGLMGESYFADHLVRRGFIYIRPEELPILEQMAIMKNAETVVFAEGSAVNSITLVGRSNASFFMIPRRRKGEELFVHHIRPRAPFCQLGDDNAIMRLPNTLGRIGPRSPSYTLDPRSIHNDMVQYGFPVEPFDLEAFQQSEQADTLAYWDGMPQACEQLSIVAQRRAVHRVAP